MTKPLRILIVEDVEDHALLMVRELQKGGFSPETERVETIDALRSALEDGSWDAVISDFSLPGFTALDTLAIVRERRLDLPVIIISGVIGEETAVDAMRAGAKDFILKGKYSRLAPALERELQEAALRRERRLADEELLRVHEALKRQRDELETQHLELVETYRKLEEETALKVRAVEELRRQEQMMIQQNRMAAIGEVLNNVAHHWRQPLNVLALDIQKLEVDYQLGQFSRELLHAFAGRSMATIRQLSRVIDDFRDFSAIDREKRTCSVAEAVSTTVSLLRENFAQREISIEVEIRDEPSITGYCNQYRQVLLNILMNARDAFGETLREDARIVVRGWREEQKTVVTVTDNAGGIREGELERIFDAFYTTKPVREGTGVGLFISRSVIERMGGRLTARNVADGAEFRIEV